MHRFHAIAAIVFAIVLGLCTPRAIAWGNEGHRIVGTIATAHVNETTARALRELLGDETTADACTWADEIRSDRSYDWIKPLHYLNVPRGSTSIDLERDGHDGAQVVSAISKYATILADRSRPKAERLEALRLVLHFVGDVHQPLHVSYADDLGGNKLSLSAFGRKSNLHRVWDTDLIQRRLRETRGGGWAVYSADLRESITAEQRKRWTASRQPIEWANESLSITREIYANLPKGAGDVDDAYYAKWISTVNERLQAAGVRLAVLLDEALSSPAKQAEPGPAPKRGAAPKDRAPEGKGASSATVAPAAPGEEARRNGTESSRATSGPRAQLETGTIACTAGRFR